MSLVEDPKFLRTVHGIKNSLLKNVVNLDDKLESGISLITNFL